MPGKAHFCVLLRLTALVLLPLLAASPVGSLHAEEGVCSSAEPAYGALADLSDALDTRPPAAPTANEVSCEDTCGPRGEAGKWAGDGVCDDGGPGAKNRECGHGSDCTDCGPRGCDDEHPCGDGMSCVDSECSFDLGEVPDCDDEALEPLKVSDGSGSTLSQFSPDEGDGWWDYTENGETEDDQYRSYLRGDVQQMIKYAASWTRCLSQDFEFGNGEPLGLGDMSEADGSIPGSRENDPDHPGGSHLYGKDIDVAYFQLHATENKLRPICEHIDHKDRNQQHCVSDPDDLDVFRTALFLAKLHDSSQVRVIGVDGQVGVLIEEAFERLCEEGFLDEDSSICRGNNKLAYETVDRGRGWFRHHHHHFHLSTYGGRSSAPPAPPGPAMEECLQPGCP